MLSFELKSSESVLIIHPEGPLSAGDFAKLAAAIDLYIETHRALKGVVIDGDKFEGWQDFVALLRHMAFVRDHHKKVKRVAVIGNGFLPMMVPQVISHFVNAKIEHFLEAERSDAIAWAKGFPIKMKSGIKHIRPAKKAQDVAQRHH